MVRGGPRPADPTPADETTDVQEGSRMRQPIRTRTSRAERARGAKGAQGTKGAADWPRPYGAPPAGGGGDAAAPGSVPVTAIILARDERVNIERAVRSVGWCAQVVVVDSGSTDGTRALARAAGATVWQEPWRGFARQREWAMRAPWVHHDWVFFLDADEWVPVELAAEIATRLGTEDAAAYTQRRRLVFLGRWIAHCGWYTNSWQARLLDRRRASFAAAEDYGERASVAGPVRRLAADLVDEDGKGLTDWLHKHVRYAELEARRAQAARTTPARALRRALASGGHSTRPLARTLAKDVVLPLLPARPLATFAYMYLLRRGWRDGPAGLVFCLYHAWYALTVEVLTHAEPAAPPGHVPTTGTGPVAVAAGAIGARGPSAGPGEPASGGRPPRAAGRPTVTVPAPRSPVDAERDTEAAAAAAAAAPRTAER
jgi:hypothetical protein